MAKRNGINPGSLDKSEGKAQVRKPKKTTADPQLTDHQKFLHDLQLQKVELEIQNEELKNSNDQNSAMVRKYSILFEEAPVNYLILSPGGIILDLNLKAAKTLDQERSSLLNQEFRDILSPLSIPVFNEFLEKVFSGNNPGTCQVDLWNLVVLSLDAALSPEGDRCFLSAFDISESIRNSKRLKEEQDLYRSLVARSPGMTLLVDPVTEEILDASELAINFYGYPADHLRQMKFSDLQMRGGKEPVPDFGKIVSGEFPHFVFRHKLKEGNIRDVKARFEPIHTSGGSWLYSVLEDITGRKRAEEVQQERNFWTNENFRDRLSGTFSIDFTNDSWSCPDIQTEILGVDSNHDRTVNGFISLVHPDQKAAFQYFLFSEILARKQPLDKKILIVRPGDKAERWIHAKADLVFDDAGMLTGLQGTLEDITRIRHAEEALAETEKMYRLLMNASPDGIAFFDTEGNVTECSSLVLEQFGAQNKEDLLGKHFLCFIPRDERKKINSLIECAKAADSPQSTECRLLRLDNSDFVSEISLSRINLTGGDQKAFIAIIRDVTARKKKERQLIHLDRMAHLGEMATGMAHEINQPLNNIAMALDNVFHEIKLKDTLQDAYLQHKSDKIFDNIVKIKNLIEHIREFAREDHSYAQQTFDLNEAIQNAVSVMLMKFDEKRIDLLLDLDSKIPPFIGDTFKVEQVIMNLLLNAKDALEEKENKHEGALSKVIKIRSYQEDGSSCIEITDNGIGIRANEIEKVMHPFFTTKETGKGVGLGLSVSYGIITEMNGRLEVESKYLIGTTLRILLPVGEKPVDGQSGLLPQKSN